MTQDLRSEIFGNSDSSSGANFTESDGKLPKTKTLDELRRMVNDFIFTTQTNRTQGFIDYDYYDGHQLTVSERQTLQARGQPDIVVNRTKVAVNGILGVIARSNTDPKAWPRSPTEDDSASVATDCLRFVMEKANFNRLKVEQAKDNFVGGCNAVIVTADEDENINIDPVRWEELIYDPRSRKTDFTDARYMGIAKWMYADDVVAEYGDKATGMYQQTEGADGSIGVTDEVMADRPINQGWLDYRNKRFLVVELYYRMGATWVRNVFWYGGVLEEEESTYEDSKGKSVCPIIAESCYVDRDNNRYGLIRDMRDLQDEINKRRSKLLHVINSSQIQAKDPSAIEVDADAARKEAARPDGVLPYGWAKVPTSDMSQGQMLLLTEAKNEMERFGPNPAVLGRQGADTSGRALLARQQAGLVELAVPLDQLEDWELRVYRAAWDRIKQYWKVPQYIRVTHDPASPGFVGINQVIPHPMAGQPVLPPGTPGAPPPPVPSDPNSAPPTVYPDTLGYKNNVAEMDVDIVIDTTPATASIMQEQLKDLMDLVSSNPSYAQQVPFEVFLDLMPIPRKAQLISQIKNYRAGQMQQMQAQQQQENAAQTAESQSKVNLENSKATLNKANAAKAVGDTHAKAITTSMNATDMAHEVILAHDASALSHNKVVLDALAQPSQTDEAAGP